MLSESWTAMISIAIAEDEQQTYEILQGFLDRFAEENHLELQITHFINGLEISDSYRPVYDIILMDVDMPMVNGISAARIIRDKDPSVIIIFVTNLSQYAIQGYSVQAFDYILKPLNYFAFSQFFQRAVAKLDISGKQEYITIQLREGVRKVSVNDIYYIEIQNHTLSYHTAAGIFQTTGKMKALEELLGTYHFSRCNNGLLINLAHVDSIINNDVIVHGETLPVSRSRKKEFSAALVSYIGSHLQ